MLEHLLYIVNNTSPRVISQVIGSKKNNDLKKWIMNESQVLPESTSMNERIWFILNSEPEFMCGKGRKKTFNANTKSYGFCGNAGACPCLVEYQKETYVPRDMSIVVEKRKQTWIRKYGVDNVAKCPEIMEKKQKTMSTRDYSESMKEVNRAKQSVGFEQVIARVSSHVTPLFTREEYIGSSRLNQYPWECKTCSSHIISHIDYGTTPRCLKCDPRTVSKAETEIVDFIRFIYPGVIETSNRDVLNGQEIDIFLPDLKFAIEYNGLYWHSIEKKSADYHLQKLLNCREQGIRLLHIYEDEWKTNRDYIKNYITSIIRGDHNPQATTENVVILDRNWSDAALYVQTGYSLESVIEPKIWSILPDYSRIVGDHADAIFKVYDCGSEIWAKKSGDQY